MRADWKSTLASVSKWNSGKASCGIKLTDCSIDLVGVGYAILNLVAGMAGNPTSEGDFSTSSFTSIGVNSSSVILDDTYLVLQRSTLTMYKI